MIRWRKTAYRFATAALLCAAFFLSSFNTANAACSNPTGIQGEIVYNSSDGVFQGCKANDTWQALHSTNAISGYTPLPPVPTEGLIAHFTLDDTSGSVINDETGSYSATWQDGENNDCAEESEAGVFGNALRFDGIDNEIAIASFDPPHQGTISVWVKLDAAGLGTRQRILGFADAFEMQYSATSKFTNELFIAGGATDTTFPVSTSWTNITASYDYNSNISKIYIDGHLVNTTSSANDDPGGPATLTIGDRTGSGDHFDGLLDDIRIYNRVLSDMEVAVLYGHTSGTSLDLELGLVGYWPLDEKSGSVINDVAGSNTGAWVDGDNNVVDEESSSGKIGNALIFDDTNTLISAPDDNSLDITGNITISAWINAASIDPINESRIIMKGPDSLANAVFALHLDDGGYPEAVLHQQTNQVKSPNPITVGQWHHILFSYDGANEFLYMDGELQKFDFTYSGTGASNASSLWIGGRSDYTDMFDGKIDDLRLYNRSLNSFEAVSLYAGRCFGPSSYPGEIVYNSAERVFQGCAVSGWRAFHNAGSGAGGCSNPAGQTGEIIYNTSENYYQGCTVDGWHALHR